MSSFRNFYLLMTKFFCLENCIFGVSRISSDDREDLSCVILTKINLDIIKKYRSYRTVNTLRRSHKNQHV